MNNIDSIKETIKADLHNVITEIDKVSIRKLNASICIDLNNLSELSKSDFEKEFKNNVSKLIENESVIYSIELIDADKKSTELIYSNFNKEKVKKEFSLSKINETPNSCFYVGSSKGKTILKRIREHIGFGSKSTYALHLNKWCPTIDKKLTISFVLVDQKDCNQNLKFSLLELVEQNLWDKKQPMFGKRSGLL